MNWIYAGGYALGGLVSARIFYSAAFEIDYKDSVKRGLKAEERRLYYAKRLGSYFAWFGIVWPIAWPALVIVWFVQRPTRIERNIEKTKAEEKRRERQRQEEREREARIIIDMARIKKWAEENKMPLNDSVLRMMAVNRVERNEDVDFEDS